MKRKYGMFFLDADKGGGDGGAADPSKTGTEENPLAALGIDPNNLDDETREKLTQAFATLQTEKTQALQSATNKDELIRRFQSEKDKYYAQVQALTGNAPQMPKVDPMLQKVEQLMVSKGVKEDAAKAQAPIMADILKSFGEDLKKEIGGAYAPIVSQVMGQQASSAFQQASVNDPHGRFAIPEVAQKVWTTLEAMAQQGQAVDPQVATNLASMAYFDYLQAGGRSPMPVVQPALQTRSFSSGGFNFPGAGFATLQNQNRNQSPTISPDTQKALDAVNRAWGITKK